MGTVLFGTDGVRGVANADLSVELAMSLGQAAARVLRERAPSGQRPRVVIGRDTRRSGPMLEAALAAGLASEGFDVLLAGVVPTPGVSFLTRHWGCAAGAVISASHNPAPDNGIKFFAPDGSKLPEALERDIERFVLGRGGAAAEDGAGGEKGAGRRPVGAGVGRIDAAPEAIAAYRDFLLGTVRSDFSGWKVVIDCAHGAASAVAPRLFEALGCQVVVLNAEPDGMNINVACGSTHPEGLQEAVRAEGARIGLAFDGDADRMLAVDEEGSLVDGDRILALCGADLLARGKLAKGAVAATVYSNMGLDAFLRRRGGRVIMTPAGDRAVAEAMAEHGLVLGGEKSGHIIFAEYSPTGDGLISALQLMELLAREGRSLSELAREVVLFPQVLENVRVVGSSAERRTLVASEPVQEAIARAEGRLGPFGRVFVRPSGTEPLVRVMGEGEDEGAVRAAVKEVVAALEAQWAKQAPGLSSGASSAEER